MGADTFHVCYGLRWELDADDEAVVSLLEKRQDPRQIAANHHNLESWWGHTTDEGRYFLLIGTLLSRLGWEGTNSVRLPDSEADALSQETKRKLKASGLEGEPAWHYQFEPDY